MLKSFSLSPCRARMQLQKTSISLDIELAHFIEMHKSLSLYSCRAKTHQPKTLHPTLFTTHSNTHASLKCRNRSRLTPVQRKRSPETRRCYQALKSHTLWKCRQRSRPTRAQRKRSHGITQKQTHHHNAYFIEMPQSLSADACAAKTLA